MFIVCVNRASSQHVFFEGIEPAVDDVSQRTLAGIRSREAFHHATINGLQFVQRCFGLRYLYLRRREAILLSMFGEPTSEERLTAPVLTTDGLEQPGARLNGLQFVFERRLKMIESGCEGIESLPRNGAASQSVDDLLPALGADFGAFTHDWSPSLISNCVNNRSLLSSTESDASSLVKMEYPSTLRTL